jgi:hypothetical protein
VVGAASRSRMRARMGRAFAALLSFAMPAL